VRGLREDRLSDAILNQRLSVDECLAAVDECGAPVVSIAGGEPLLHKEIEAIVNGIVERRKFVYLCTNALLLQKRIGTLPAEPVFRLVGAPRRRPRCTTARCARTAFTSARGGDPRAKTRGFRVNINCTLFNDANPERVARFFDAVGALGIDGITVSPGYAYERAPIRSTSLPRAHQAAVSRHLPRGRGARAWSFSQSGLFLDFLAGNRDYHCTPWGNPTRNVFGWQRPCYLLGEAIAASFRELMDETDWDAYGTGNYEKCANCMVHSGYEATRCRTR
jgi:hopanoid biosynthesis associated radical SAM protein HpnH